MDQIKWYQALPVFVQVGNFDKLEVKDAIYVSIEDAEQGKLVGVIEQACQKLNERLQAAFTKFDKKQNGKIQIEKVGNVLANAGLQISESELESGSDSLDINGDGKVIYEELRKWWFSGHRARGGLVGNLLRSKVKTVRYVRSVQSKVNQLVEKMKQQEQQPTNYSTCDVTFNLNEPKNIKTKVEAALSFYSERSEAVFQSILKLHPKFKPNQFERSHHIICFHFTQPTTRILADELKPLVNDLSKRFDIPVSLYCDD